MFYSPSTRGFYHLDIHGENVPDDAVELTREQYDALLSGQSRGLQIVVDEHGWPSLKHREVNPVSLISDRRYRAETAGLTTNGMQLSTDRGSQAMVGGATLAAMADPNYTCKWKIEGGFVNLGAMQIISMASAIRTHVQACFDREAELLAHLEAGTFTEAMLDEGWPN